MAKAKRTKRRNTTNRTKRRTNRRRTNRRITNRRITNRRNTRKRNNRPKKRRSNMMGGVRGMDWVSNAWNNRKTRAIEENKYKTDMEQLRVDATSRSAAAARAEKTPFQMSMHPFMTDDQIILETNKMLDDARPSKAEQGIDDDKKLHSDLKTWGYVEMLRRINKQSPAKSRWQKAKDRVLGQ